MATTSRVRRNWLIHSLFVRNEQAEALTLIEEQLRASGGLCEYALYIKGLIRRQQGNTSESLQLFQAALCLNPRAPANLKQVARSLFLAGRHRAAVDVYNEAERVSPDDWEVAHSRGVCLAHLGAHAEAEASFLEANAIARHPSTFLALARSQELLDMQSLGAGAAVASPQDSYPRTRGSRSTGGVSPRAGTARAIETLTEALEHTPDHPELLTALGLAYHRSGDSARAFEHIGASMTRDTRDARTVLAAGALIQEALDFDVSLAKYRVAALAAPNSAPLWSNIGMCFFGKGKHVAAVACLQRSQYLDPFQWGTALNLGLVHLHAGQFASAFHHFNAAANLRPDHAETLMYLAITLSRLDDGGNAKAAYEKAIHVARGVGDAPHLLHLNYATTLVRLGEPDAARVQLRKFEALFQVLPANEKADADIVAQRASLQALLGGGGVTPGSPTGGSLVM